MEQIIHNDLLERAGILEEIRKKPRDLIKFIPENERVRYDNDFTDDILSMGRNESQLDNDDLDHYKKKVSYYILQHQDIQAIAKLKGNQAPTPEDVSTLEKTLWGELDYDKLLSWIMHTPQLLTGFLT